MSEALRTCSDCALPVEEDAPIVIGDDVLHERCAVKRAVLALAQGLSVTDRLLTPQEVAHVLGESRDSVMRRKEEIGFVRLRRDGVADSNAPIRFRREDVDRYIASNVEVRTERIVEDQVRRRPMTPLQKQYPHLRSPSQR